MEQRKKLEFHITINAHVNKIYDIMLGISNKSTYEQWTALFSPTSTYEGKWEKGSKILFIGTDDKGERGGMVSVIVDNVQNAYVLIEHIGILQGGEEITKGTEAEKWAGAYENYFFEENNGTTHVKVEVDTPNDFGDYMSQTYPKALAKLKEICEK